MKITVDKLIERLQKIADYNNVPTSRLFVSVEEEMYEGLDDNLFYTLNANLHIETKTKEEVKNV